MIDPSASRARRIFLLPPVRLVLSLLMFGILSGLPLLLSHVARGGAPGFMLREGASAAAGILTLICFARYFERRPPEELGLQRLHRLRDLGAGFLLGAGLLTLSIGILASLGWYHVVGIANLPLARPWSGSIGRALLLFGFVAVTEEVVFRGILFRILEEGLGTWLALALSSAFFGFGHLGNPGASVGSSVAIMLEAGMMLGAAFMWTRGLAFVIGIHWAWNFFEGPVFGTSVSGMAIPSIVTSRMSGPTAWTGGSFGPEAGIVVTLLGSALGVLFLFLAWRRGEIRTPAWMRRRATNEEAPVPPTRA